MTRLFKVTIKKEGVGFLRDISGQVTRQLLRSVGRESVRLKTYIRNSLLSHRTDYSVKTKTGMMKARTRSLGSTEVGGSVFGGVVIGEGLPYTHVHAGPSSMGSSTVIRPVRAKALTIPLRAAVDGRGVVKPEFRDLRSRTDLFTPSRRRSSPGGLTRGILYQRLPGGRAIPLFLLRSSVTVPRRIFTDSVAAAQESQVSQHVEADVGYLLTNMRVY